MLRAGPNGTELVPAAATYTRIRALGFPAALVMTMGQASCLAYQALPAPAAARPRGKALVGPLCGSAAEVRRRGPVRRPGLWVTENRRQDRTLNRTPNRAPNRAQNRAPSRNAEP